MNDRDAQTPNPITEQAEGGTTWQLPAADGNPAHTWDSRDHATRLTYDALRRPTATFVRTGADPETCPLFTRYGEQAEPDPEDAQARRLFGQPWRIYDTAGLLTTVAVDPMGHITETTRQHVATYNALPDWSDHAAETDPDEDPTHDPAWVKAPHDDTVGSPDDEVFHHATTFDLAGRPTTESVWRNGGATQDKRFTYDPMGLLTVVEVRLRSTDPNDWRPVLHAVTHNARGQRLTADTGDDGAPSAEPTMRATYTYDPDTFRLLRSRTTRPSDTTTLQDLRWGHDAVGNITFQEQAHLDTVWYSNTMVSPHRSYRYDALDRLVHATGREHDSTVDTAAAFAGSRRQVSRPFGLGAVTDPGDITALRPYTQTYTYDAVGNLTELKHIQGGDGGETFTRAYHYTELSDGSLFNNQLESTSIASTTYPLTYDAHGNTVTMAHLPGLAWDVFDRLASVQTQARYPQLEDVDPENPEDELDPPVDHDWFYLYDASGQRVRKVRARHSGDPEAPDGIACWEERIYVGSFEVWRKVNADGTTEVERETLHIMDGEQRVAMVETLTWDDDAALPSPVSRWRYQLDDHLGTATGEVTEAGLVIGWEEFHPYGTTAVWSFDSSREVSGKRYRYTGMERDDETGLGYHSARYYAAWLGRWLSPDPAGVRFGCSTYVYTSSSPISWRDPSGWGDVPGVANEKVTWTIMSKEDVGAFLASAAAGGGSAPRLDARSAERLSAVREASQDRKNGEAGFAIFQLSDGSFAVSSTIQGEIISDDIGSEESRVDWTPLMNDQGHWLQPVSDMEVTGVALIHTHARNDKTPETPSIAAWTEGGRGIPGDVAALFGANREGQRRGELPLDVPTSIVTIPDHPKTAPISVISRGAISVEKSDKAHAVLRDRLALEWRSFIASKGGNPLKPVPEGFSLDRAFPTLDSLGRVLDEINDKAGVSSTLTTTRLKDGSRVRFRSFTQEGPQ